jgi:Bacterial TSP3 repeat
MCIAITVTPKDTDGDGYSDAREDAIGKDPLTYCGVMRADVDGDGLVSILDLSRVARWFGDSVPPAPRRFTQAGAMAISILDLARMATYWSQSVISCP